jgi:hypothetical protein
LDEKAARLYLDAAASRHRRQLYVFQLCGLGIGRAFPGGFTNPEFRGALAAYPSSAIATPHLFAKVGVPNLCTA